MEKASRTVFSRHRIAWESPTQHPVMLVTNRADVFFRDKLVKYCNLWVLAN